MTVIQWLAVILMILGELCVLISLLGVFRLKYVLNRMHATTIADTLGTLLIFAGVILLFGFSWTSAKLALVVVFQWTTCPVSGHLIARMIYYSKESDVREHAEITFKKEAES